MKREFVEWMETDVMNATSFRVGSVSRNEDLNALLRCTQSRQLTSLLRYSANIFVWHLIAVYAAKPISDGKQVLVTDINTSERKSTKSSIPLHSA